MKNLIYLLSTFLILFVAACQPKADKSQTENTAIEGIKHVEWAKNAVIYEVNIRQYSEAGNFQAFTDDLPRLKELGVDILWLMPIYPIGQLNKKGDIGSPYSISDYMAVNADYGTFDDFKNLVNRAHELEMKVILDWVANHTSWDNPLFEQHPEWYTLDSVGNPAPPAGTDWDDVIDLNYDNKEMRNYMTGAMAFWIDSADIDGFRCDVANMVPTEFWDSTRTVLDAIKPVFMLAEAEEPELQANAFDMTYGWEFHHIMNQIVKGEKTLADVEDYVKRNNERFKLDDYRMYFTTNHDENTWNGTVFERLGDAAIPLHVLSYALPGMPLIYNGQEAGMNKRLSFFGKDAIDWENGKVDLNNFYSKMNLLKHRNIALANGAEGGDINFISSGQNEKVLNILRTKNDNEVLFLINFTDEKLSYNLTDSTINGEFRELFSNNLDSLNAETMFELEPWAYKVYYK